MFSLINKSNAEICDFLFNGKKADALELSAEKGKDDGRSGFTDRTVYQDKNIEVIYSFLKIEEDDIIEQFFIYSNWWGSIKNSFFTIEGEKGKFNHLRCGVINLNELKKTHQKTSHEVNNKNMAVGINVTDFASFTQHCQRVFRGSPTYDVVEVISLSPNSWVKIEIVLPNGEKHYSEGTSKKDAANRFAAPYFF